MITSTSLNTKQRISENLGSNQVIATFDELLSEAAQVMIFHAPDFFDMNLAQMMHSISSEQNRRAFSNDMSNNQIIPIIIDILAEDVCEKKLQLFFSISIDRIFILSWTINFHDRLKKVFGNNIESLAIIDNCYLNEKTVGKAIIARHEIELPLEAALLFREMIMEKYYKSFYLATKRMIETTKMQVQSEDLFNNVVLTAMRAMNKYSAAKGTLTEFMNMWLKSAFNSKFDHFMGQSYLLSPAMRLKMSNTDWVDNDGARSSLAHEIDAAALSKESDVYGSSVENELEKTLEGENFISVACSMLDNNPDIRTFMMLYGIAHTPQKKIDIYSEILDLKKFIRELEEE